LVDGIKGVGLYSIVGGIDEELRDVGRTESTWRACAGTIALGELAN